MISINSFVPADQQQKLAVIADANTILAPTLAPHGSAAPVTPEQIRLAAKAALAQIDPALAKLPKDHPLALVADDLRRMQTAPDEVLMATNAALTRFLPDQLAHLRTGAERGAGDARLDPAGLRPGLAAARRTGAGAGQSQARGADAGRACERSSRRSPPVAPDAGGSAVTIAATADTIVGAFRQAAIYAVIAIALHPARSCCAACWTSALVMAPLLLSALLTLLIAVLLPLPLNFANIIALPLLLGVGVSFNIYFVMNWRAGQHHPLGSATARAILFSALTTGTAFGSLALSAHPGTASMGKLLLISLGCTLAGEPGVHPGPAGQP